MNSPKRGFPALEDTLKEGIMGEPWFHHEDGADDGARTRDLRLGKATLYQLSYIRNGKQRALNTCAPVDATWNFF